MKSLIFVAALIINFIDVSFSCPKTPSKPTEPANNNGCPAGQHRGLGPGADLFCWGDCGDGRMGKCGPAAPAGASLSQLSRPFPFNSHLVLRRRGREGPDGQAVNHQLCPPGQFRCNQFRCTKETTAATNPDLL